MPLMGRDVHFYIKTAHLSPGPPTGHRQHKAEDVLRLPHGCFPSCSVDFLGICEQLCPGHTRLGQPEACSEGFASPHPTSISSFIHILTPFIHAVNTFMKDKVSYDIPYMQNLSKMIQMNLFTKQKQTHRLRKQTYGYQKEE